MTTAAAIAREDRLRYTGPERCSGDGQVRAAGDRYSTVIWLLGGNLLVRSAGFGYPFLAYHVAGRGHGAGAVGAVVAPTAWVGRWGSCCVGGWWTVSGRG